MLEKVSTTSKADKLSNKETGEETVVVAEVAQKAEKVNKENESQENDESELM